MPGDLEEMLFGEFGPRLTEARAAHGRMSGADANEALGQLARFFHALAGVAPSVGFPLLGKTAGIGEALADAAARGDIDGRAREIAIVLAGEALDGIEQFFASREKPTAAPASDPGIFDEETLVYSASFFRLRFEQEIERAARYHLPLSLALVEIAPPSDGDSVLAQAARLAKAHVRAIDLVARLDAHLAILLPHTPGAPGDSMVERLTGQLAETDFVVEGKPQRFGVRRAVVEARPGEGVDDMVERAARSLR